LSPPKLRCCGVHFVGSIPLATGRDVFATLGRAFGDILTRIPDGETGDRTNWIQFQEDAFARTPTLEGVAAAEVRNATARRPLTRQFRVRDGMTVKAADFPRLGYADSAIASWRAFDQAVQAGEVPRAAKFLVAIPTPYNVISFGIAPEARAAVEPAYAERLMQEVDEIMAAIPHDRLSFQWDCAHDVQAYDGAREPWFTPGREGIVARMVAAGNRIPADVDMGFHLCYGSFGGRHFVEPRSTQAMVEITNGIVAGLRRRLDFMHMPVPIERDDDAYYAPLRDLVLGTDTELYLGLVHDTDGVEGTLRRAAVAARYAPGFGIAAECGFGRRPADCVPGVLAVHRQAYDRLCEVPS